MLARPKNSLPGRQKVAQQPGMTADWSSRERRPNSQIGEGLRRSVLGGEGSTAELNQQGEQPNREAERGLTT